MHKTPQILMHVLSMISEKEEYFQCIVNRCVFGFFRLWHRVLTHLAFDADDKLRVLDKVAISSIL